MWQFNRIIQPKSAPNNSLLPKGVSMAHRLVQIATSARNEKTVNLSHIAAIEDILRHFSRQYGKIALNTPEIYQYFGHMDELTSMRIYELYGCKTVQG